MIRSEVGVADLLHSIVAIAPNDRIEWVRIAAVLGFRVAPPQEARPTPAPSLPPPTDEGVHGVPRVVSVDDATAPVEQSLPLLEPTGRRQVRQSRRFDRVPELEVEHSTATASTYVVQPGDSWWSIAKATTGDPATKWPILAAANGGAQRVLRSGEVLTIPGEVLTIPGVAIAPPPALEPLLRPLTTAATLRTVALVSHSAGPLDEQTLVRDIASRKALTRLPRRLGWRLTADVLVLEDWGEGMEFFVDDLQQLTDALRLVVGKDNVRVTGFVGDIAAPAIRAGLERGTVVLIASDLGISRLAEPEERAIGRWNEIVDTVSAADAHLLVVTPYGSDRWPPALARRLPIVTWDRSTTVGAVLKAIRARG